MRPSLVVLCYSQHISSYLIYTFILNILLKFALNIQELSVIGEVTEIQGSTGIQAALTRAIQRGVPQYNQGNHARCAAIYQTALEDILLLRPDDISPSQRKSMERSLQEARAVENADERAWAYRTIIDSLMSTL